MKERFISSTRAPKGQRSVFGGKNTARREFFDGPIAGIIVDYRGQLH